MRILTTLLALLLLPAISHADLVGLWRFDDSGNIGLDSSSRNNQLTPFGDATLSGDSKIGSGSLLLDGNGDYLGAAAFPTDIPIGNSAYTIAAWINPAATVRGGITGWGTYGVTNQANGFRLHPTNPNSLLNYWWGNDFGVDTGTDLVTGTHPDGWNHVAAVYDPTASGDDHFLFLNGVQVGQRNSNNFLNVQAQQFTVGRAYATFNEFFDGLLDDVAIFNQALTAEQLLTIRTGDFSQFGVVPEPSILLPCLLALTAFASRRRPNPGP